MKKRLTPAQRQRESALFYTLMADIGITALIGAVAFASGSLTIVAELVRMSLMLTLEVFSLLVMWRIHRGRFADFEFGHGKIEQLANIGIALALLGGGIAIFSTALSAIAGSPQIISPLGLAVAAAVASINTFENFVAWAAMRRAAKVESSSILEAQMQARWVKLVSSLVVQVTLTVAALTYDPLVAHWMDAAGAIFVSGFMVLTAFDMLRGGLPDLLDRGVDEAAQLAILRALSTHFHSYYKFYGVRSRRSSGHVFVEVELGYPGELPLSEVDRRRQALEETLREELGDCEVAVKVRGEAAPAH